MNYTEFISEHGRTSAPTHRIKLGIEYCTDVYSGRKNFELRKNDRNYKVGDTIQFIPFEHGEIKHHPISECVYMIRYIFEAENNGLCGGALRSGWVILAIVEVPQ